MTEKEFLFGVLKGNLGAVELCLALGRISQVWDDLVDGDTAVEQQRVNEAFFDALIAMPALPFYRQHFEQIHPLLQVAAYDWLASNELHAGSNHDKTLAFVLRDNLVTVVLQCAFLVGGHGWAIEQAPRIRRFFHNETLGEYLAGDIK